MVIPINEKHSFEKKLRKALICPRCKNEVDTRIHRGFIVKTLFFWLPLKRYICYGCRRKTYKWD